MTSDSSSASDQSDSSDSESEVEKEEEPSIVSEVEQKTEEVKSDEPEIENETAVTESASPVTVTVTAPQPEDEIVDKQNDDTLDEGETTPAAPDEDCKDSSDKLGEAKSCEIGEVTSDGAVNDPAVDGEDVLDSPATKEELGKEKDVIDKVLPDVDKARGDADDGSQDVTQSPSDWMETVEHSQQGVGMHQKVLQGKK